MGLQKTLIISLSVIVVVLFFYEIFLAPTPAGFYTAFVSDYLNKNSDGTISQLIVPDIVDKASLSTILIQSFKGGQLLQSGGGLVLTQDGLIITLNSLVPIEADFYQITIDDKLDRGRVVIRDNKTNLAIVALDESGLLPIDLRKPLLDQEPLFIAGRLGRWDKTILTVFRLTDNDANLPGSLIVNSSGETVGIANSVPKTNQIISADSIEELFFKYVLINKHD